MEIICKNCAASFDGKFCPQCGQAASEERFNLLVLGKELQTEIFPIKKGLFFTIRQLFTKPVVTVKNYLEGKRIQYLAPLKLLLSGIAFYLFVYSNVDAKQYETVQRATDDIDKLFQTVADWLQGNLSIATILGILPYAFFSWLFFRKSGYKFAEHIVIYFFVTAIGMFSSAAFLILGFLFNVEGKIVQMDPGFWVQTVFGAIIYYDLMQPMKLFSVLVRYFFALLSTMFVILLILLLVLIILL